MISLSDREDCREYEKVVSRAVVEENGLKFELVNNSKHEIAKWKIDGCVVQANEDSRCDYLLIVEKASVCYWVELKDEDLDDACSQICNTMSKIKEVSTYKTHFARIILGRFKENRNRIDTLRYINYKKLINRIGSKNLIYKTKFLSEII